MAVKKKTNNPVVFTGFNNSLPPQSNLIQEQVQAIPNYEDSGVKYQGKYKNKQGQNSYELKTQTTRWVICTKTAGLGYTLYDRARPETKFYVTKIIVNHRNPSSWAATDFFILADVLGAVTRPVFHYQPTITLSNQLIFDLSDCPREFTGDHIGISTPYGFGAGEWVTFQLYGWEEQP